MSDSIKTNRLNYSINRAELSKKYDIYAITTADKYFKGGAKILDAQELDGRITSLMFEYGNTILLLSNKDDLTPEKLRKILSRDEESDSITIERQTVDDVSDFQLLQLLLNGLGNYDTDFLRVSNLTGHCYLFHPQWLKHSRKTDNHLIWQVPSLEIRISPDMCLTFPVRTFTSTRLKNQISFNRRKFSEYPQYVLTGKNTLRRKLNDDEEESFILRQLDDQKTEISFLDIKNLENFEKSKLGIVEHVIKLFNCKYAGISSMDFSVVTDYKSVDYTRACAKENTAVIKEKLSLYSVRIVDTIQDEFSSCFCEDIRSVLLEKYEIKASIGKKLSKTALNIRLIHNAEYYDGIEDQHKIFSDIPVQHITFEDFSENADFAIDTVIHELLIKQDIQNHKISLFDWSKLKIDVPVSFGIPAQIDSTNLYVFIKVMPDGSFEFTQEEFDLFHIQQYQDCINIFEDAKAKKENILGLIRSDSGKINVIKETGWITLPEINKIHDELASGNTKLRGKQARDEYLSACIDVKAFKNNNAAYYFVGAIGEGMRYTLHWASKIRKIEPYQDAPLMYEPMLPMMSVTFVRNGQLTIVPFPFKYLREYVKMQQ